MVKLCVYCWWTCRRSCHWHRYLSPFYASYCNVHPYVFLFPMHHGSAVVQAAKFPTGTPLFMGLNVLRKKGHNVSTELETLMYVLMFTLSGGKLPWRHIESDHPHLTPVRFGVMASSFEFSHRVLKHTPNRCRDLMDRLRLLFFTPVYRTNVTCAEFIAELHL